VEDVNFKALDLVEFPAYRGNINVNMMPILMGVPLSIPHELWPYAEIVSLCTPKEDIGKVGYLTVHESEPVGVSQRRPGLHTEGFGDVSWGGGAWGGRGGLFMANTVAGSCAIYDTSFNDTAFGGEVPEEAMVGVTRRLTEASRLYWIHDRTPHESLPHTGRRQFFRLVTNDVTMWFEDHSTRNPLGIEPEAHIISGNKFRMEGYSVA
jgi:hypothetical protein